MRLAAVAGGSSSLPLEQPLSSSEQLTGTTVGAFWKFLRPHTIRGTVLGTTAVRAQPAERSARSVVTPPQVVLRALSENPSLVDLALVPRALLGLLALLCGNGYIVGINQVGLAPFRRPCSSHRLPPLDFRHQH